MFVASTYYNRGGGGGGGYMEIYDVRGYFMGVQPTITKICGTFNCIYSNTRNALNFVHGFSGTPFSKFKFHFLRVFFNSRLGFDLFSDNNKNSK